MTARRFMCLVALLAAACGPSRHGAPDAAATTAVRIELVAGSGGPALTRVHVAVAPRGIGVDLVLDGAAAQWNASVTVPAGVPLTLTATAWSGGVAVGSSTATVTAAQHETALVAMTILDTSQRPAGADHGPVLTAIASSVMKPTSGVPVTLSVSAVDPDRDAVTYSWRDSCGGTFSRAAASTVWTPAATGTCTITASATARGLTGAKQLRIPVAARPAVTIEEDLGYAVAADPLGTYAYAVTDASYGELTSESTTAFAAAYDEVRLVRYVVANAGSQPVAIEPVVLPGGWELVESWLALPPPNDRGTAVAGTTCEALAGSFALTPACGVGEVYAAALGDASALGGTCVPSVDPIDEFSVQQSATITSRAYELAADGADAGEASLISGKYVIPAAVSGVPGKLALYLVRPVASGRVVPSPVWNGSAWVLTRSVWMKTAEPTWTGACAGSGEPGESGATWEEYQWRHWVDGAEDWLSGTMRLTAYATSGGVLQGSAVPLQDVDVARVIGH